MYEKQYREAMVNGDYERMSAIRRLNDPQSTYPLCGYPTSRASDEALALYGDYEHYLRERKSLYGY